MKPIGINKFGLPPPVFIGGFVKNASLTDPVQCTLPAGSQVGDLWCSITNRDDATTPGAAYLVTGGPIYTKLGYKLLTATDLTNGYVLVSGLYTWTACTALVFRGGTSFAVASQLTEALAAGDRSITTPAFTPSGLARGLVACYVYYRPDVTAWGPTPAGWTFIHSADAGVNNEWANYYNLGVSGAAVTFACTCATDEAKQAVIYEIR